MKKKYLNENSNSKFNIDVLKAGSEISKGSTNLLPSDKTVLQIYLPIVISSALTYSLDHIKIIEYYENLAAYVYTQEIIKNTTTLDSKMSVKLSRFVKSLAPFITILGFATTMVGAAVAAKNIINKNQNSLLLLEKEIEITELEVSDDLVIQYFGFVLENNFNATAKDIVMKSMTKYKQEIEQKIKKFETVKSTIISSYLNKVCFIISSSEYEQFIENEIIKNQNIISVDFSTEIVEAELYKLNNPNSNPLKFTTKLDNVLGKPKNPETISVDELINYIKGVKKVN